MSASIAALLLVPLLLPIALPPLARRALDRLAPRTALWALTAAVSVLGCCSLASLGAFVLTGLLRVPLFAALGELVRPLPTASSLIVSLIAAAAVGALTVTVLTLVRSATRHIRALRTAHVQARSRPLAGDLCVIDSPHPDAYALPGRPDRIVVTSAMLRSLEPGEREALFAHERAHNASRHHYFLGTAELAAHCHPALRPVRAAVRQAAERAADEAAAAVTGDRRLTARAVGRAALAARSPHPSRPPLSLAAASGPVPQRVAALLAAPGRQCPRAAAWTGLLLAACILVSAGAAGIGVIAFHHEVEFAQGEVGR
ncbi:M48 family metalloprotease [Streptomyces sp. ODS28]|uniref:M48 family metalloprotease n=1 Tax=Streptomyces sp. ODS28 TaxID=3136688 RepID=UPI0031E6BB26